MTNTRTTKGTRIDGVATIVRTGFACSGNMAWETPYVVIAFEGSEYRWHSDTVEELVYSDPGTVVKVRAFAYGRALRRVTMTREGV